MKRATMLVSSVLLAAQLFAEGPALPRPTSVIFDKGAMFTVAGYTGSSPLSNFPVLVRISGNSPVGFSYGDLHSPSNGSDIAFVDMDGNGLAYEIDTWNPDGTSLIWVKLPTMEHGTQFVMCWGSAASGKTVCDDNPFAGYKGVWHMNTTSPADASGSGNGGTAAGSPAVSSSGAIGSALSLPTTSDYVTCGTHQSNAELKDAFTVEAWVNPASYSGNRCFFGKDKFISIRTESQTKINVTTPGKKDHPFDKLSLPNVGTWWHLVVTFQKTTSNGCKVYTNGVFAAQQDANDIDDKSNPTEMWLGKNQWGQNYTGLLDEMRLSAGIKSADWIAADYATQTSNSFLSVGIAQSYGEASEPVAGVLVSNVGYANATVVASISSFGIDAESANVNVQVSTAPDFASTFFSTNYVTSVLGECNIPLVGLATGTAYYARAIVVNDKNKSMTTSVANFTTQTPGSPNGTAEFFKRGLRSLSAIATVTAYGAGSTGASVRLEASTNGFETIVASAESAAALGTPTNLIVSGLLPMTEYSLRVRVRNGFGIDTYVDVPTQSTCSTPFVAPGIGWEFSPDESALDVYIDITGLQEPATGTATLAYSGEFVGSKTISGAGRIVWTGIRAKSFAVARVVFSATLDGRECSETFSAEIRSGTSGIYVNDIPSHCSADGVLHAWPGDAIVFPSLEEGGSYKVLNDSFASISGNVLTALEPGILGVQCIDSASATNVLPVLILPEKIGAGTIYLFDQTSTSATAGGTLLWSDTSLWKRLDGVGNASYPHTPDDTAIIALYGNAKEPKFQFDSVAETFVGSVYMGRFDDTYPGSIANFTIGTAGDEVVYRRIDGGMPVVRHCQNSTYSGMLILNGTHKFENSDVNVSVGAPSSGLRIGFAGVGEAVFHDSACDIDSLDIGRGAGTGRVEIVGGTFAAKRIIMAQDAISVGVLSISNGAAVASAGDTVVGNKGSSILEVGEGGTLTINGGNGLLLSNDESASHATNTVLQTGGLIEVKPNFSNNTLRDVTLLQKGGSGCFARLQLNGGIMRILRVKGGDGSRAKNPSKDGVAIVSANGGTLEAIKEGTFLYDLEHVECGPSGLTIVSDYDITNAVDFVNLEGVPGVLTMKGSGVKTLTGGNTTVSRIVVSGGKVVFAAGARAASELVLIDGAEAVFEDAPAESGILKLVVGSQGSFGAIRCTADSTLEFACPIEIVSARIALGGMFEAGRSYVLMTTSGAVDHGSRGAWAVPTSVTGLGDALAYEFSADLAGGVTEFSVATSAAGAGIVWNIDGETTEKTISGVYPLGRYGILPVEVGDGATLNLNATVTGGGIVKIGSGTLRLGGRGSSMPRGVTVKEGFLVVGDVFALGEAASAESGIHLAGGRFCYAGEGSGEGATLPGGLFGEMPSATDLIDLKIDAPLIVTNAHVSSGCVFKRGAGTLAFAPGAGDTMTLSCCDGYVDSNHNVLNPGVGDISPLDWASPTGGGYNGFNVAEGTVVFAGGAGAKIDVKHISSVGIKASGMVAAPVLVVDGVAANLSSEGQVNLGSNVNSDSLGAYARLVITNGARVVSKSMRSGVGMGSTCFPTVVVERATWSVSSYVLPYGSGNNSNAAFIMRDGGAIYIGTGAQNVNLRLENYGGHAHKILIDGEGSVLAYNPALDGLQIFASGCSLKVSGGGVLSTWRMYEKETNPYCFLDIAFDGGTWMTAPGKWQPLKFWYADRVSIRTESDRGLTFPVAGGQAVEATQPITGVGGMVKTGSGALKFQKAANWTGDKIGDQSAWTHTALGGSVSLAFEGTLDVQGGDVFVESGACRVGGAYNAASGAAVDFGGNDLGEGVAFSGGGKFSNFTVTAPTISVPLSESLVATNGAPWFLSAAISGPVLVDFGSPVANARGGQVAVATFADSIPSASSWLMTGVPKGYAASLMVSGSAVVADIHRTGFTIRLK